MVYLPSDKERESAKNDPEFSDELSKVARHAALAARTEIRKLLANDTSDGSPTELLARHGEVMRAVGDKALDTLIEHTDLPVSQRALTKLREWVHADVVDLVKAGVPSPVGAKIITPEGWSACNFEIAVDALWWDGMRDLQTPEERRSQDMWFKHAPAEFPPLAEKLVDATKRLCQQDVAEIVRQCEPVLAECEDIDEFWDSGDMDDLVTDKLTELTKAKVARLITRYPGLAFDDVVACFHHGSVTEYGGFEQLEPVWEQDEATFRLLWPLASWVAQQSRVALEEEVFYALKAKTDPVPEVGEDGGPPPP